MKKQLPGNLLLCSALAFLLSYLEYYYVTVDGIPYREIYLGSFLNMPPYFLFPLAPALALPALVPILNDIFAIHRDSVNAGRDIVLSMANFLSALTLYDILYYAFRSVFPLSTDPLAGRWITAGEAPFTGLVNLLGAVWPTWYFATVPVVASVYLAYYISPQAADRTIKQATPSMHSTKNRFSGKWNPASIRHALSRVVSLSSAVSCVRCGRRTARDDRYCDHCGLPTTSEDPDQLTESMRQQEDSLITQQRPRSESI